jgi:hypothetical protein
MTVIDVDMMDNGRIAVMYDDGTTAVYDAEQLKTLKPIETAKDQPGWSKVDPKI